MSSEQVCYTIINNPTETETPNEQQLKHDIGKYNSWPSRRPARPIRNAFLILLLLCVC